MAQYSIEIDGPISTVRCGGGFLPPALVQSCIISMQSASNIIVRFIKINGEERELIGKMDDRLISAMEFEIQTEGKSNKSNALVETSEGWKSFRFDRVIELSYINK